MDDIKKKKPVDALNTLFYNHRRSASILYKVIKSAVDSAKNTFKIDENLLKFKLLTVEQGPVFKRFRAGSKGSAKPYKRKTSHVRVVLEVAKSPEFKKIEAPVVKEEIKKDLKTEKTLKVTKKTTVNKTVKTSKPKVKEVKNK